MPRKVTTKYVSLKSSLVNLPISLYGPLVERQVVRRDSVCVVFIHLYVWNSRDPSRWLFISFLFQQKKMRHT